MLYIFYFTFTVHGSLKLTLYALATERDRLKTALESDSMFLLSCGNSIIPSTATGNIVASLRNSLNQALQQNADLRSRLARIHDTADLSDISSVGPASEIVSSIPCCTQQLKHYSFHNPVPHDKIPVHKPRKSCHNFFFHWNSFKDQAGTYYRKSHLGYSMPDEYTKDQNLNNTQYQNLNIYTNIFIHYVDVWCTVCVYPVCYSASLYQQ